MNDDTEHHRILSRDTDAHDKTQHRGKWESQVHGEWQAQIKELGPVFDIERIT